MTTRQRLEELLQRINGIGPAQAAVLAQNPALGDVRTEAELRRKLADMADLPIAARIDIQYRPLKEIPRPIIVLIDKELHKCIPKNLHFDIAGGYRRKKPISHDIDILIRTEMAPADILAIIRKHLAGSRVIMHEPFELGTNKASVIIHVPELRVYIKADVYFAPANEYMFALLYATGSGDFNIRMRAVAKKRGYLLNQRGLFNRNTGDKIPIETEYELFKKLHMPWKEPEERIN